MKNFIKKHILFIVMFFLVLTIAIGVTYSYYKFISDFAKENLTETVAESFEGYELSSNATKFHAEQFQELKKELKKEKVDDKVYSSLITKLFLSDYFNLNNKIDKNHVGGINYIYENYRDDFTKISKNTIYDNIKLNLYGNREQKLPEVTLVTTKNITNTKFALDSKQVNAIKVSANIKYKEDLGYPLEAELVLISNNGKMEIVKMS